MSIQPRNRPFSRVLDTLPLRLACNPYLEVLKAVVVLHAILVMHILVWMKRPTKVLFHEVAMLKNRLFSSTSSHISTLFLRVPAVRMLHFLLSHPDSGALNGTVRNIPVGLNKEWFFACRANLLHQCGFSSRLAFALVRAIDAALLVGSFGFELATAVGACFGNGRRACNTAFAAINPCGHFDFLTVIEQSLYQRGVKNQPLLSY
jgi:hypothetical protein